MEKAFMQGLSTHIFNKNYPFMGMWKTMRQERYRIQVAREIKKHTHLVSSGDMSFYTSQRIACSAELNVNKSSFSVSQSFLISPDRGYGLHIKRKYDIMPALSLKYRLDGFHPYIKLGVMFARFHSKEYIILDRQKLGGDKKFWHISLIGAVGQDIPLTPNIDLRMEFLISGPGKNEKRIKESEHFLDVMRKISITKAFKLGIIYKF
ncbi:hypothetical protein OAN22_01430 [Alphaproteobacteria bacterium]|nr:hypothetical protein [Alphaproteobacteria bacterium]MDC0344798.1 hypothetical protein [Alphaproteobacteria bacterium]